MVFATRRKSMTRLIVDTNVWIALLRREQWGQARFLQAIRAGDEIIVIPVVYYELTRGRFKRDYAPSIRFIGSLWAALTYVKTSRDIWNRAARLWAYAVAQNQRREDAAVWIAALALSLDATIVTGNEAHVKIFRVPVVSWMGGPWETAG